MEDSQKSSDRRLNKMQSLQLPTVTYTLNSLGEGNTNGANSVIPK